MELDADKRIQTAAQVQQETETAIKAIETGNSKKYDANLTEQEAKAYEKLVTKQDEGRGKTLLLIESNVKVQNSLREKLKEIGYRVLITSDPARGLSRFSDLDPAEDLPADCVLFGCAGLGRDGIKAFEEFANGQYTSDIPAMLFVMEKLERFVKPDDLNEKRIQLSLPIKFKHVRRGLRTLLNLNSPVQTDSEEKQADTPVDNRPIDDTDIE